MPTLENDDEFNLEKPNKPIGNKGENISSFRPVGGGQLQEGYVQVGTKQGSYAEVTFMAVLNR